MFIFVVQLFCEFRKIITGVNELLMLVNHLLMVENELLID